MGPQSELRCIFTTCSGSQKFVIKWPTLECHFGHYLLQWAPAGRNHANHEQISCLDWSAANRKVVARLEISVKDGSRVTKSKGYTRSDSLSEILKYF